MPTLRITPRELLLTMERLKADCRQMALDAKALWGSEETQRSEEHTSELQSH